MPPTQSSNSRPAWLALLTHRRWSLPVLAELGRGGGAGGCKLVWLERHLGAGRGTAKDALLTLIELGLAEPNPGYGHPMRPEYLPTRAGQRMAPHCEVLLKELERVGAEETGLRKWSLPVLFAVGEGATRFTQIRAALPEATDRAISQSLRDLEDASLVLRTVSDTRPPRPCYSVSERAKPLVESLVGLLSIR